MWIRQEPRTRKITIMTYDLFRLDGKTALVTGAATGLGQAIAVGLAKAGANIVGVHHQNPPEDTRKAVEETGRRFVSIHAEMTRPETMADLAKQAAAAIAPIDILVNNAGIGHVGTVLQTTGEDLDRLYRVNVRGVFHLIRAFLPGMLEHRRGSIINIASIGGIVAVRDRFAYVTTKFAVVGITKQIALDHSAEGVRCNCICPGRVETPFVQARLAEYPDPAQAYREMSATQLIGRMGRPEEIAAAAHYLASDEAALVTGAALMADGGWSVGK
jgi:NAD(P)-dependent dehydrogenase (short-subunit alcohol dehydrogenase family)